jgi:hypothetical protein
MVTEPILSIEVKPEVEKELWQHYQAQIKQMVWTSHCSSSFKNGNKEGPIDVLHPGSRMHYFACLERPRWEDFNVRDLFCSRGSCHLRAEFSIPTLTTVSLILGTAQPFARRRGVT